MFNWSILEYGQEEECNGVGEDQKQAGSEIIIDVVTVFMTTTVD